MMGPYKDLFVYFMDDVAYEVGPMNWLGYAFVVGMVAYFGGDIIPFGTIIFGVMTTNLVFVAVISGLWDRVWRQKYASGLARETISAKEGRQ